MSHNYHRMCGCYSCCQVEEAAEREPDLPEHPTSPSRRRWKRPYGSYPYHPGLDVLVSLANLRRAMRTMPRASFAYSHLRERAYRKVSL
jgi:hypothetical protein